MLETLTRDVKGDDPPGSTRTASAPRCRHIVEKTRSLIAVSRRLLNPGWAVSGGSDDGDRDGALMRSIRSRLARGVLIPAPDRAWAGHGTGKICVICAQNIDADEIENQTIVREGDVEIKLGAHIPCFNVWWWASRVFEAELRSSASAQP